MVIKEEPYQTVVPRLGMTVKTFTFPPPTCRDYHIASTDFIKFAKGKWFI